MIERTQAYRTADGQTHPDLESAQRHELIEMFTEVPGIDITRTQIAEIIVKQSDRVLDILSTTPTSKPRARKINGGTKKRVPKTEGAKAAEPTGLPRP